jgi:peptide deformylase
MMKLVKQNDKMLKYPADAWDFSNPPMEADKLIADMTELMLNKNGIGLSACQVGLPYGVFIMGTDEDSVIPIFNPRIVNYGTETEISEEGCLTFPGLYIKMKRSKEIRARYQTPAGETLTSKFTGMTARIFQHEYDHINGVLYTRKAHRFHLDAAKKNRKMMMKELSNA